jgi:hypothetical protein
MHSETPGIMTALALFLLLEPAVIFLNFKPWFLNPNHPTPPQPERFFKASIHSFLAMVITGAILTTVFSGIDYTHTPLIDWYGYNNICIVFDTKPSTYISPVYWFFVGYLLVRYAIEDTRRVVQLTQIGPIVKAVSYAANVILVLVAAFFSLCLAIGPSDNMFAHTVPFVALVLAFPLVFVMHCLQHQERSPLYIAAVITFTVLSFLNATFILIALVTHHHLPVGIAQTVDILWLLFALPAPFLTPPPKQVAISAA